MVTKEKQPCHRTARIPRIMNKPCLYKGYEYQIPSPSNQRSVRPKSNVPHEKTRKNRNTSKEKKRQQTLKPRCYSAPATFTTNPPTLPSPQIFSTIHDAKSARCTLC